eukprot:scaffold50717_cov24-Tisochrysis_lutea.AAC.1
MHAGVHLTPQQFHDMLLQAAQEGQDGDDAGASASPQASASQDAEACCASARSGCSDAKTRSAQHSKPDELLIVLPGKTMLSCMPCVALLQVLALFPCMHRHLLATALGLGYLGWQGHVCASGDGACSLVCVVSQRTLLLSPHGECSVLPGLCRCFAESVVAVVAWRVQRAP